MKYQKVKAVQKAQAIKTEWIEKPILDYVVVSQLDVDRMIKSDAPFPIVTLALVDEKLYPIGGFAALEAAKKQADDSVQCMVYDYKTKEDAVQAGVRQCGVLEKLNLSKMPEILGFFGGDMTHNIKMLNMGGTLFEKVARARLVPEIYDRLADVLERLSSKLSAQTLAVDPQFLLAIAKADTKKQLAVFETICESIDFKGVEAHFTWPNPAEISLAIRQTGIIEEEESVVVHADSADDSVVVHVDQMEKQAAEENDDTLQILKQSKHCMVSPNQDGTHLVVDTKAKTLKTYVPSDDHLNFDALDVAAERAVIMPPTVVKHLDLSESGTHSKQFDSPDEAIAHLGTIPNTAKVAVFWK